MVIGIFSQLCDIYIRAFVQEIENRDVIDWCVLQWIIIQTYIGK